VAVWGQIRIAAAMVVAMLALGVCSQPCQAAEFSLTAGVPSHFDDLVGTREVVLDIYFGGKPVGEARALVRPGFVQFRDPAIAAALLAPFGDEGRIQQALQTELPSNSGRACTSMAKTDCGHLEPRSVGVIYDEDRFRVDFFLAPDVANAAAPSGDPFLHPSSGGFALVSSLGAALSGAEGDSTFNFQSRTIVSLGDARLKSNISYSSELGAIADDLLLEVDRPNWRYVGGLFWTPGTSLIGRRRILGVGAGSQFDTRADRDAIEGTALPVFVQQASVVEILVDGRLAGSQVVEAGNQLLDTSGLPEGAYPILLRIREPGRGSRDERRFFVKDTRMAPEGHVRFQALAGFIAPTRKGQFINPSEDIYYQLGAAKRLSANIGAEAVAMGTQDKVLAEGGLVYISKAARVKIAGLASTKGEFGAVLQAMSAGSGPAQFSFDLRRVWDKDGGALIPGSIEGIGFDADARRGIPHLGGDYTQFNATMGYNWGRGGVRLFASYFDTQGSKPDYSIGPSADWLIVQRQKFQVRLEADAQKSRDTASAYLGVRFLFTNNHLAVSGSAGHRSQNDEDRSRRGRMVGNVDAEWSGETKDLGRYSVGAGLDRTIDATTGRASGYLYSRYGNVRTDVLHDFEGRTHYGVSLQTGAVFGGKDASVGGRNINESALLIAVDGAPSAGEFEVLVDEAPAARITAGQRVTLFMQPYRRYDVRLRPVSATSVHYDAGVRKVTLFPGNVERLRWNAVPTVTVFGQVVGADGKPIANGVLQGSYGGGASNADGFFQIDAAAGDRVTLSWAAGQSCELDLGSVDPTKTYVAAGKVVCQ
jgi:hypothetical protein